MDASDSEGEGPLGPFADTEEEDEDDVDLEVSGHPASASRGRMAALQAAGHPWAPATRPATTPARAQPCTASVHAALELLNCLNWLGSSLICCVSGACLSCAGAGRGRYSARPLRSNPTDTQPLPPRCGAVLHATTPAKPPWAALHGLGPAPAPTKLPRNGHAPDRTPADHAPRSPASLAPARCSATMRS